MLHRPDTLHGEFEETGGPAADAEPDEPEAGEPEAAAGIDYSAPEFRDAVSEAARSEIEALFQGVASQQANGNGDQPAAELDPYGDPQGTIDVFRQIVQQELGQIKPTVQAFEDQQNQAKVEEWASAIPAIKDTQELLGEAAKDLPENTAGMAVQFMATGYLRDLEQRYGPGERAVRGALGMAADQLKQIVAAANNAGYQLRDNELKGIVNARQPAPAGTVEHVDIEDQSGDEMAVAARWANRRGLA